ncbi:MAG: hypothetical protein RBS07_07715 [Lentimicrobium sp.]|jgi:hypothetical protein|nr:hypothetical protein [Lentimicrobium sp.]
MDTYTAFSLLKERLNGIASVFQYTGQYLADKTKTRYKVPALYIEFVPNPAVVNFGKIRCLTYQVNLHYIAQAPFNVADNQVQQTAMRAHAGKMLDLYNLVEGMEIGDVQGRLLIGQCLILNRAPVTYQDTLAVGVLTLQANLYDYSAAYQSIAPKP